MNTTDFGWLIEQGPTLAQDFGGKWIAVCDGRVVGIGDTAPEASFKAREKVGDADFILEAVDREADVIYVLP